MNNKNHQKVLVSTKKRSFIGTDSSQLLWTAALVLTAVIAPMLLAHTPQNQLITGIIVNAVLFVAAWKLGLANAFMVAVLPSTVALVRGLLPAPMAIMIPFIIISNCLLVLVFSTLKRKKVFGVFVASLAKFGFLFLASSAILSQLNPTILAMMQWPQLITAMIGGFFAIGAIQFLKEK